MAGQVSQNTLTERAVNLCRTRACPHCHNRLTTWEAISMVVGDGFEREVMVRLLDGKTMTLPLIDVDPRSMEIIDD